MDIWCAFIAYMTSKYLDSLIAVMSASIVTYAVNLFTIFHTIPLTLWVESVVCLE